MAAQSVRIVDQFGQPFQGRGNTLFDASRWDGNRPMIRKADRDVDAIVSAGGNRELMSLGRYLFANVAPLQNAIRTISTATVGDAFIPQYYGRPQGTWGDDAESLLFEWHKICVVNGGVYDWQNALKLAVIAIIRDGDIGILLTETETGYPQIQLIPAHRIGSPNDAVTVEGGEYDGRVLVNGAILDDVGRILAWRIYNSFGKPRDISANDLHVYFRPDWAEQARGFSSIASGIRDWQDRKQAFEFLRMALKKEASYAVVEHTEEGALDPDANDMTSSTGPNGGTIWQERVDGGSIRVFRANSGSKVEFPESSRPSQNSQAFWERVTRDGLQAISWPFELTYDASKIGGASLRMVMEVAQRTISEYQTITQRIATRIDSWRLAKAIKAGELPPNPDWWKVAHQTPAELTADRGYAAQADREDYKLGFVTLKDVAAKRGVWWEEERAQQELETDDLLTRSKVLAVKHGISIEAALSLLQQRSPNPPTTMTPQPEPTAT